MGIPACDGTAWTPRGQGWNFRIPKWDQRPPRGEDSPPPVDHGPEDPGDEIRPTTRPDEDA
jgi:hypothetical protein